MTRKAQQYPLGLSPRGKTFPLTPEMIARRHGIAKGLGYIIRNPCSIWDPSAPEKPAEGEGFDCVESEAMDRPHRGHLIAAEHCRCSPEPGQLMSWPDDVEKAAWAIDKGKP